MYRIKKAVLSALIVLLGGLALDTLPGSGVSSASLNSVHVAAVEYPATSVLDTIETEGRSILYQAVPADVGTSCLSDRVGQILVTLRESDCEALAVPVHLEKGVILTPYSTVEPNCDRNLLPAQPVLLPEDGIPYAWSTEDNTGTPIELTGRGYFERYASDADYTAASETAVDTVLTRGNALKNAASVYPEGRLMEYHSPGLNEQVAGYDWCFLKLVSKCYQGDWCLVGLVYSEWTVQKPKKSSPPCGEGPLFGKLRMVSLHVCQDCIEISMQCAVGHLRTLWKGVWSLKIIIVGDGEMGFTLAEYPSQGEHDTTVIDANDTAFCHAPEALDVMRVKGNGASISALGESGVDAADVPIAATSMNEVNTVYCLTAKRLGAKYMIARIRNVEYVMELSLLEEVPGIDLVISPENVAATKIARLLRFPPVANLETFCRGQVELIGSRVREEGFLVRHPLSAQNGQLQSLPMLFCAAEWVEGDVAIPNDSFVSQVGDQLYLTDQPTDLTAFSRLLGRYDPGCHNVFLMDGGRIAHYLTAIPEWFGIHVKIIERNLDCCRHLSGVLPEVMVICGDGTDQEFLREEDVATSDVFVTLADRDEDNLIISLYIMQQDIPKVVAKSNRQNYAGIAHAVGLDDVISPKPLTTGQILQAVRGTQNSKGSVVNALYKITDGHAEAVEFAANATTRNRGTPLRELRLKPGILVAVPVHQGRIVIPGDSSSITASDTVIVIPHNHGILDLNGIFEDSLLELGGDA